MRGDVANLTRVLLVRLAASFAFTASVCLALYVAGSLGSLSGRSLSACLYGAGGSGLAAIAFSVAGFVAAASAPAAGARLSISSILVSLSATVVGAVAVVVFAAARAAMGGLAF
ncbi:MAG: hypothetical protein KKA67_13310 [Spirochaetes bacterium]|nr:hypothetical protein [Spirochaetota bacterium]MBU1080767.1 hypothetical protein [Spirochaetota bacterium]